MAAEETAPATCPNWCVREHSPHFPPVHASGKTAVLEPVGPRKSRTTEVSMLQFGDEPARIRLHTYAPGHQCGKRLSTCTPIYIALGEAEEQAAMWERGSSPEVATAIRAAAGMIQQGLAVSA